MKPSRTYGSGEKVILAAEDDEPAYLLLQEGFSEVGGDFRLYRVLDGEQALLFLRCSGPYINVPRPHLILLNLNMPRVNGDEVLRQVGQDPSLRDIPAIVFSSSRLDADKAKCLALGARRYITKPTDFEELLRVLRNVCEIVP